jgi:hypothetical protein
MATLDLISSGERIPVSFVSLIRKCMRFRDNFALLARPYQVQSDVSIDVLRAFVSAIEGGRVDITDANFQPLFLLCKEFGFDGFAMQFSPFRAQAVSARALNAVRPLRAAPSEADFTFLVNGIAFVMGTAEAGALSPAVAAQLLVDACARTFSIWDPRIDVSSFDCLLSECIRNAAIVSCDGRSLGLLFGDLWNSELEAAFLGVAFGSDSLSLLSVDALDSLLSEAVFAVEIEDLLFRTILGLGEEYFPLLLYVRWDLLNCDALTILEADAGLTPPESVWREITDSLPQLLTPPPILGFNSAIILQFPALFAEWRGKRFNLLWRGERDGFGAKDFHDRCDGHINTLLLIEDKDGNIFGGFTPHKWECSHSMEKIDPSLKSFLFTLKNPHNHPARRFYLKVEEKNGRAIWSNSWWGPYFYDMIVSDNCHANSFSETSNFGTTYTNDTGMDGATFFTGSGTFQVKEIEVFEITD